MRIKQYLLNIRDLLLYYLDSIYAFRVKINGRCKKHLLFIRLDAIGDFILWLDAARVLREYYEGYHITFVGNALYNDLAKSLPYFDTVISVSPNKLRKDLKYRFQIFQEIRKTSYEKIIHFPYTRSAYFPDGEAIVHIARSPEKIGSIGDPTDNWRKKISDRFYTRLLSATPKLMMELERNAEFLNELGVKDYLAKVVQFPFEIPNSTVPVIQFDYILFPGAGSPKRQWPLAAFASLADRIYQEMGWQGLICGGPGEEKLGEQLMSLTKAPLRSAIGKTSLTELISLISQAQLLIGNETSAVHIAAAVNTPAICLLGGGHYGRFMPYPALNNGRPLPTPVVHKMTCFECNWQCIFDLKDSQPVPCIENISVDAVWKKIEQLLTKSNSR